jgi:endonuclease/exonuclease/phosphatase family metal-dependent hydrolase
LNMTRLTLALSIWVGVRLIGFVTEPLLHSNEIHRLVGERSRTGHTDKPDRIHVLTWNIEYGEAFDSVLAELRALDADVVLLQEVDRGCRRSEYRDVARELAAELGMNWVAAGEFQEIGEARGGAEALTGQAILSKSPIEDAEVLRFEAQDKWRWSINPVQPRRGGRIALKARTAGLVVYNTHIESGGKGALKRRQVEEILSHQSRSGADADPVVIAGDFNSGPLSEAAMFGDLKVSRFVDALGAEGDRGATSLGQPDPIDWIFVKNVTTGGGRVVRAARASDHYPVVAALWSASVVASAAGVQ